MSISAKLSGLCGPGRMQGVYVSQGLHKFPLPAWSLYHCSWLQAPSRYKDRNANPHFNFNKATLNVVWGPVYQVHQVFSKVYQIRVNTITGWWNAAASDNNASKTEEGGGGGCLAALGNIFRRIS